jgi:Na+/H+-dicarboxylate symporter
MRIIVNKLWQFKLPLTLAAIILSAIFIGPYLPEGVQRFLYAISLSLKELLVFSLPFIVFSLILNSIVHLKGGAIRLILIVIPLMCVSNFIATWIAYFAGDVIVHKATLTVVKDIATKTLVPTWDLALPGWIETRYAMLLAIGFGLLSSAFFVSTGQKIAGVLNKITAFILNRLVIPLLPFMILGFVIKMQYEDVLDELINNYAYIFSMVAILQLVYILPWYVILAKFKTSVWLNYFKNMVPPFITGFSTLSSAATMPLTLIATRKNVHDPDVVNFVIPTTVNFHLIGDCLAMPIFAMALMLSFGYELPSMGAYLIFSLYYVLARFSAAAIPGGGAIVIWPLLMSQFGFTSDMLALIHTLNLVFDPMITSMNIMGNGAFAILFNKVFHWSKGSKAPTPIQA